MFLRAVVFTLAIHVGHLTIAQYTSKADTRSYIANAAAMCGERSLASMDEYDVRVFPGYPALIAIVHRLGISLPMSALWVTWICAGVTAAVAAKVFDDARAGWAMTCLIPHYLINSSLGMSEAPVLAVVCLALWASKEDHQILAGIAFAFAGMIRPMACFALAGVLFSMLVRSGRLTPVLRYAEERGRAATNPALRRTSEAALRTEIRGILLLVSVVLVIFAIELLAFQLWTGNAMRGIHVYSQNPGAYGGEMITWPFHSLLTTPARDGASIGRVIYIWIHVLVTLAACAMAGNRIVKSNPLNFRNSVSAPWLIGNTAFVLCIGSVWGFRHFPRFTIPAAPAMFWTLRKFLPRHPGWWMLIAAGCGIMAVYGVIDSP